MTWTTLDVRNREQVRDVVEREGVTHIVHGAAITALPHEEVVRAAEIIDVNLGGTINVLAVAASAPAVAAGPGVEQQRRVRGSAARKYP